MKVIDGEISLLEKAQESANAQPLSDADCLKLCRYTQVLHRCLKAEIEDADVSEVKLMSEEELDDLVDRLVDLRVQESKKRRTRELTN